MIVFRLLSSFTFVLLFLLSQFSWAQMFSTFSGSQFVYGGGRITNILSSTSNVNPAYLGAATQTGSTLNLMQVGFNSYSNNLGRSDALKFLFSKDSIATDTKNEIAQNILQGGGDFRLNGALNINWVSGSWIKEGFGGLSINLSDYIVGNMLLGEDYAATLFTDDPNGTTPNPNTKDLNANVLYNHTRVLSLSYGRSAYKNEKIKVFLGASYRHIWGIGHFDSSIADSTGNGYSSFSEFYSTVGDLTIDSLFSNKSRKLFDSSGGGQSFSAGVNLLFDNKLSVDFAAINLGRTRWKDNVMQANDAAVQPIDSTQTIDTYQVTEEVKSFANLLPFQAGQNFATPTNAEIRLNVAYRFTKALCVYTDLLFPTKNQKREYGYSSGYLAGVDVGIIPQQFHFTTGAYYNKTFGWRMPAGLAISIGDKSFLSITTADIVTILTKKVKPMAALSISLIGVNF
jgi:hypothetical protein